MQVRTLADAAAVATEAARFIAQEGRGAVAARGRFILALSGGRSPLPMFRALVTEDLPWSRVYVAQVDERVAPAGHSDRNLTHLRESLLERVPLPPDHILPMPVEAPDLKAAVLARLRSADPTIPAGRVRQDHALLLTLPPS